MARPPERGLDLDPAEGSAPANELRGFVAE